MNGPTTANPPALPSFFPRPQGIPVASFTQQKILTKAIRSHAANQNLRNTKIKGPDVMGGKRGGRSGRGGRTAARANTRAGSSKK